LNREKTDKKLINARFRGLMLKNHPDIGGSAYVAFKVNEAKEILMGEKQPAGGSEQTPEEEEEQVERDENGMVKEETDQEAEELDSLIEETEEATPRASQTSKPKPSPPPRKPTSASPPEPQQPQDIRKRVAAEKRRQFEEKLKEMRRAKDQELADFVAKLKKDGIKAFAVEPNETETEVHQPPQEHEVPQSTESEPSSRSTKRKAKSSKRRKGK